MSARSEAKEDLSLESLQAQPRQMSGMVNTKGNNNNDDHELVASSASATMSITEAEDGQESEHQNESKISDIISNNNNHEEGIFQSFLKEATTSERPIYPPEVHAHDYDDQSAVSSLTPRTQIAAGSLYPSLETIPSDKPADEMDAFTASKVRQSLNQMEEDLEAKQNCLKDDNKKEEVDDDKKRQSSQVEVDVLVKGDQKQSSSHIQKGGIQHQETSEESSGYNATTTTSAALPRELSQVENRITAKGVVSTSVAALPGAFNAVHSDATLAALSYARQPDNSSVEKSRAESISLSSSTQQERGSHSQQSTSLPGAFSSSTIIETQNHDEAAHDGSTNEQNSPYSPAFSETQSDINEGLSVAGRLQTTLAEAEPVTDERLVDESGELQVAESVDEQKVDIEELPPPERNKRMLYRGTIACIIAVVIIVVIQVALIFTVWRNDDDDDDNQSSNTTATTSTTSLPKIPEAYKDRIRNAFGAGYLTNPTSLQEEALRWIVDEDALALEPEAENLIQRFSLVYFYLETTRHGQWDACNPPNETIGEINFCYYEQYVGDGRFTDPNSDYLIVRHRYVEVLAMRWLSGEHECQWAGVFCNTDDHVIELRLDRLNLHGLFASEITKLTHLRTIALPENNLRGTIPPELALLPDLEYVALQHNQLEGSIPGSLVGEIQLQLEDITRVGPGTLPPLQHLKYLNLQNNTFDAWRIPTEIGLLRELDYLNLDTTSVTGTLPSELFLLSHLEWLNVRNSAMSGSIPTEVGQLSRLELVSFGYNDFTGTLPSEVALLSSLIEFDVFQTYIGGTIPEELYFASMDNINALILAECMFTGTLSTEIGLLSSISYLLLRGNSFSGTIPTELANLDLRWLDLNWNNFSGTMPSQLCSMRGDTLLWKLKADCQETSAGVIPVTCPDGCCTHCCTRETEECVNFLS